jgi:hypothetical protein
MRVSRRSALLAAVAVLAAAVAVGSLTEGTAGATPAYVQGTAVEARTGTTASVSFGAPVTPGDLVVVYSTWDNSGAAAVSDSQHDTFPVAAAQQPWAHGSGQVWYTIAHGGTTAVTATFATPVTQFGLVYVMEYSGVDQAVPFDTSRSASGGGAAMSSGVATTTGPDLVVGAGASDNTVTAKASSYTSRSLAFGNIIEDTRLNNAGTPVATATQNGSSWVMQLAAFHAAPAGTTTSTATTQPSTTSTTATTLPTTTTTQPGSFTPDSCAFTTFCDAFQTLNPGGRSGDLDETKWSFSRVQQNTNPTQGLVNNYAPVNADFCITKQVRLADNDSFICGAQFGESNHWMEAMNDNEQYASQGARILQPFDFANRTGTIDFSVDAKSEGTHSSWPDIFIAADPVQQPHEDFPGTHIYPREGVQISLNADWCPGQYTGNKATQTFTSNAVRDINVYDNYQESQSNDHSSSCFSTAPDMANHFQIRISQTRVEVWASNDDGSNFSLRLARNVNLGFTRGYVSFEHAQYNADKFNDMNPTTYHWHAISFDGPVLPLDRDYQVPDALVPRPDGTVNLGYQTPTQTFSLPGGNPSGASKAYVTANVYWYSSPLALTVTVNGHAYTAPAPDPNTNQDPFGVSHRYQWSYILLPVNLADLAAGTNTVQIANTGCSDQCPTVANVDLEVVPG